MPVTTVTLQKGEKKKVVITQHPDHRLKFWTPDTPDLYTLLLTVNGKKQVYDCKATRFGWRQFKIVGDEFQLNGKKYSVSEISSIHLVLISVRDALLMRGIR